jgi:hypothetical protein
MHIGIAMAMLMFSCSMLIKSRQNLVLSCIQHKALDSSMIRYCRSLCLYFVPCWILLQFDRHVYRLSWCSFMRVPDKEPIRKWIKGLQTTSQGGGCLEWNLFPAPPLTVWNQLLCPSVAIQAVMQQILTREVYPLRKRYDSIKPCRVRDMYRNVRVPTRAFSDREVMSVQISNTLCWCSR